MSESEAPRTGLDALKALAEADAEDDKKKLAESLTLREKLLRRAEKNIFVIELPYDLGTISIRCRMFRESEQRKIIALQSRLNDPAGMTPEAYDAEMEKFYALLAYPKGICREPELTFDYWQENGESFGADLTALIYTKLTNALQTEIQQAQNFRRK